MEDATRRRKRARGKQRGVTTAKNAGAVEGFDLFNHIVLVLERFSCKSVRSTATDRYNPLTDSSVCVSVQFWNREPRPEPEVVPRFLTYEEVHYLLEGEC